MTDYTAARERQAAEYSGASYRRGEQVRRVHPRYS